MRNLRVAGVNFTVFNDEKRGLDGVDAAKETDVVLCGYSVFEETDLNCVFTSDCSSVKEVARVSGKYAVPVFCGLKTRLNGYKHLSAAVANRGKIIDLVRRTQNVRGDEYENSDKIKVYKTEKVNVALLIDTDVLLIKNWQRIAETSDMVVSIGLEFSDEETNIVSAFCRAFKLPYVLLTPDSICWGEPEN